MKLKYVAQSFLSGLTFGLVPKPVNLDVDAFFKALGEESTEQVNRDTDAMFAPALAGLKAKNAELDAFEERLAELLKK